VDEDPQNFLFAQVFEWMQHEQAKRNARKIKDPSASTPDNGPAVGIDPPTPRGRSDSQGSETTISLGKLEDILSQYASARKDTLSGTSIARKRSRRRRHSKGLRRGSVSESEYDDAVVPSVDATLDNSKTLAYTGGAGDDTADDSSSNSRRAKEHWATFKSEILRIVHTLRIRGWRRVPSEKSADIEVTRLSGALTNAVYVVAPPKDLPPKSVDSSPVLVPRKPPP
jgi:choline kinase